MRKSKRSETDKFINHRGRLVVVDSLFPEALLNIRTITKNKESSRLNTKHLESLSQFITTRDYRFFIEALRLNRELLRCYYHNKGRSLDVDSFLEKNDYKNETVDDYTVVRTTINWLRELHQYVADADNAENARKILEKISPLLVIQRTERVIQVIDEYFIHVFPKVRGEHPSLEYKEPHKFIDRWHQVKTAFEVTKSKKY